MCVFVATPPIPQYKKSAVENKPEKNVFGEKCRFFCDFFPSTFDPLGRRGGTHCD